MNQENDIRTGEEDTDVLADAELNAAANAGFDSVANSVTDAAADRSSVTDTASGVTVEQRTATRKVRGKAKTVNLPQFNVYIDGTLTAVGSTIPGKPIMALAEILGEEQADVIAAVAQFRGDKEEPKLVPTPKVAADQVKGMK